MPAAASETKLHSKDKPQVSESSDKVIGQSQPLLIYCNMLSSNAPGFDWDTHMHRPTKV